MSNKISAVTPIKLPTEVSVKRSDPVYMAHGYLTKVPIAAIQPYIEAFTSPGDVVLDPFAGSGMTGVAAMTLGRNAELFDVSVLGRHIGSNYTTLVDATELREAANRVVRAADEKLSSPYLTRCSQCHDSAQTSKVTCSVKVECPSCTSTISFYRSLETAGWRKGHMICPSCAGPLSSKNRRAGEVSELETVRCACSKKLFDQVPHETEWSPPFEMDVPSADIEPHRQMYIASALGKHGLTSTSSFFSERNAAVLTVLRDEINGEASPNAEKLMFAFTGILARASKRYQWSKQRPLNASNSNYYVAPVFYEWNVFELFLRKVEAVVKSDTYVRAEQRRRNIDNDQKVSYRNGSATQLPLDDNSVDYVFTDPPFGWNIFYSDMNMFHEAWLASGLTDPNQEAVIDRSKNGTRTPERYEDMLADSFRECSRVLRPGGWITVVFGSSTGTVWAVVQRALRRAGLRVDPNTIASLHKGQRSVKGLASGFENVVVHDLILSLQPTDEAFQELHSPTESEVLAAVARSLEQTSSPSELYVWLLRIGLADDWDLSALDLRMVTSYLLDQGLDIDPTTGQLQQPGTEEEQLVIDLRSN